MSLPETAQPRTIVIVQRKSLGLALLLTLFFGPLGMFYSTVVGALVMLLVSGVVGFVTMGLGLLLVWPLQLIWTWMAVVNHNAAQASAANLIAR